MTKVINICDFHNPQLHGDNMTPAAISAVEEARKFTSSIIRLPRNTYHFYPAGALEDNSLYVSNNGSGPRSIIFPLINCHGITIDGEGSELFFHGRVSPFIIDHSTDITIRNVNIDCKRPFYTQGIILDSSNSFVELKIDREEFPYQIENGDFLPYSDEWSIDTDTGMLMIEFNQKTKAPQHNGYFNLARLPGNTKPFPSEWFRENTKVIKATEISPGLIRLESDFKKVYRKGNILVITHGSRKDGAFVINESSNTLIESVNIYHIGGMGVIAQLSDTVTCRNLEVRLREGTSRILSTNADATHFVNCTGKITIKNCVFENMNDDATNIHGISTPVLRIISNNTIEVGLNHHEQYGVNIFKPGDRINVLDRSNLLTKGNATVKNSELVDPGCIRLQFEESISELITADDALDNPDRMPEIQIRGCKTGNNRPRGFLVSSPKKTIIKDNVFYNSGCGVQISGDANFWFESGAVTDVTIRRNLFEGCGYAGGSQAIVINPEVKEPDLSKGCFHRNITIEDNLFKLHNKTMLYAKSVDGLTFINNRYEVFDGYPPNHSREESTEIITCSNVINKDNVKKDILP